MKTYVHINGSHLWRYRVNGGVVELEYTPGVWQPSVRYCEPIDGVSFENDIRDGFLVKEECQ